MELHAQPDSAEYAAAASPSCARSSRREIVLAASLIALLTLAAYADSFTGPFVFDGEVHIELNPALRTLWPPWAPMIGTRRPMGAWSFAANYALGGLHTWGYHVVNLAIHLAAALALFGVVRRSLASRRLASRFSTSACSLAMAVALLWAVHPLQTQSVTYICQRYESLMGLFLLLTLYGFIRAQDSLAPNGWYVASVASCLLAAMTKEVAAAAPLLVLWYDRALVASSWREIVRRRWAYYAGLAATLPILAGVMLSQAHHFAETGLLVVKNLTPWQYALTQPGVIARYLRLCFWPVGLCLDYRWPVASTAGEIVPPALLIATLLAITIWAIFRFPAWGFLGAWFFLILAPTSSVFPIRDLAFEHRMYLPLAAVIAAVVVSVWLIGQWFANRGTIPPPTVRFAGKMLTILTCLALGMLTFQRNLTYRTKVSIWEDTVAKAPGNARAHYDLGVALANCERTDDAIAEYEKALAISPRYVDAHYSIGLALATNRRFDEAISHYGEALAVTPDYAEVHCNMALALVALGQVDEAIAEYDKSLEAAPDYADAHYNVGLALAGRRQFDEAVAHYRQAVSVKPDYAEAHGALGVSLAALGQFDEAIAAYRKAIELKPEFFEAHNNLANALIRRGRTAEAIVHFNRALAIKPDSMEAHFNFAVTLANRGRLDEAVVHFRKALELKPDFEAARKNLAAVLREQGKADQPLP